MPHHNGGGDSWFCLSFMSSTIIPVRNRLSATRWQVTPRILPVQTMLLITSHKPHYMNTIKLFGHGPGTGPRKALSYEIDRIYAEALKDAHTALTGFPQL